MAEESGATVRLCPHCANSVAQDAVECFYCKADFSSQATPSWLNRGESSSETRSRADVRKRWQIPATVLWLAGILTVGLFAFFAGGYMESRKLAQATETARKQLLSKDQIIQTQETQLEQTRQQLKENATRLGELTAKVGESRKELAVAQQKLGVATREVGRLSASRSQAATRTASRDAAMRLPQPAAPRQTPASGVYETTRSTSVYEDPSPNSRVISQIGGGTRINVVNAAGGWLEVRSKRGNPPGYVRADDARPIGGQS
jgi:hypothetical protein